MKLERIMRTAALIGFLIIMPSLTGLDTSNLRAMDIELEELNPVFVKAAVETWVREWTPDARKDAVVEHLQPYRVDGETVAYIAHLEGTGFCLCGAHNLVCPVYLYSPNGRHDRGNPGTRFVLGEIAERVVHLRKALKENDPALRPHRELLRNRILAWADLAKGVTPRLSPDRTRANPVKVELPLTCKWHQGSPFNDQCPVLSPGTGYVEHVYVGCNQIAVAQHMYYWQWPSFGEGSASHDYTYRWRPIGDWDSTPLYFVNPGIPSNFPVGIGEYAYCRLSYNSLLQTLNATGYWDGACYLHAQNICDDPAYLNALDTLYNNLTPATDTYSAMFGYTLYEWDLMEDYHSDPIDPGDAAVAKLCLHIGIAMKSAWGVGGTGGWVAEGARVLREHFRYHDEAQEINPGSEAVMINELRWMRCVGMGGSNDKGGHGWICHGYDTSYTDTRFLMNWGWEGADDDWYTWDGSIFPLRQTNMIYVAPENVHFVGSAFSGTGSPTDPHETIEDGLAAIPNGGTLILSAATTHTFNGPSLVITQAVTLKGNRAVIE